MSTHQLVESSERVMGAVSFIRWDKFAPGVVLDPFCGSGGLLIGALRKGAKAIGIEADPQNFDLACERIENSQRQHRMFA